MISLRRWTILLVAVLMYVGTMISSAVASPVDVHASYNDQNGQVTISGILSSEQGTLVTLHVINPLNQLDVLDQTAIGSDGSYQFNYVLKTRIAGKYFVNVSVQQSDQVIGTTFEVKSSTSPDRDTDNPPNSYVGVGGAGVKAAPHVTVDPINGIVSAKLDQEDVEKAITAGDTQLVVEIQSVAGTNQYQLYAPASLFSGTSEQNMTIVTEFGSIMIPSHLLSHINLDEAKEVGFVIAIADISGIPDAIKHQIENKPVIEVKVTVDGKPVIVDNPNAVVQVAIPYQPTVEELKDPEHIVVWYIDQTGKAQSVPSGVYDAETGTVNFKTTHFSTFAVAYVKKSFSDLASVDWAKKAIEVMASKGIISGTSDTSFSPEANVTRADFMMLLTKTFGFTADVKSNFSDVRTTDYFYEAVGVAKQLGLAEGQGDGVFSPTEQISRQDMMVLLSRAMSKAGIFAGKGTASDLDAFSDKSNVASYAVNDVAALIKGGIVEGSGNILNPVGYATRAEAAVLLYRIYHNQLTQTVNPGVSDIYFGI
ncbi:S-layer homology domain-containing protein [Paenibacillus aceris]|uniref:SLH domain-containing protein n=1 Tax=Paenibacillus aceris TaxID=869555 RepID=A0ABS4I8K9_9BACL|nr:S-layer homology domain-containing protein [Paenibacillus aceris]MBP1966696.1 hypothetical protein [Paenibacillus aceris]NHW34958.1 S-layer homology domain-containing protein [Paenibacillus aceris]